MSEGAGNCFHRRCEDVSALAGDNSNKCENDRRCESFRDDIIVRLICSYFFDIGIGLVGHFRSKLIVMLVLYGVVDTL